MSSPLHRVLSEKHLDVLQHNNITIDPPLLIKTIFINSIRTYLPQSYKKPSASDKKQNQFVTDVLHKFDSYESDILHTLVGLINQYTLLSENEIVDEFLTVVEVNTQIEGVIEDIHPILQNISIKREFGMLSNINDYPDVFPLARKRKRKITAYLGDTNSGKTWKALKRISESSNSAYMAPLRLLAHETFDILNGNDTPCSLVTGEEKIDVPESLCTSSTVECFNPTTDYDVVVIDEIQMIDDPDRGAFFIQALVGANAKEIIVTGAPEYAGRLQQIAEYLGDEFEVEILKRKSELKPLNKPVSLKNVKPNTAIIAFSKREVYNIQRKLPKHLKSTVLYGSLGHEVREKQAERFRNGEVDVIISTDCIGMGLNLPIKTVLFSDTSKYDGRSVKPLSVMLVKQVAGRAGRYGQFDTGYYGATTKEDHAFIKTQMNKKIKHKKGKLPALPPPRYMDTLLKDYELVDVLKSWRDDISFNKDDSIFTPASIDSQIDIAEFLTDAYPDYKRYWKIIYCPVDMKKQFFELKNITDEMFSEDMITLPEPRIDLMGQNDLEMFLKELNVYLWFNNKYSHLFGEYDGLHLMDMVDETNYHLNVYLRKLNKKGK